MAFEGLNPLTEAEAVEALKSTRRIDPTGAATAESLAAAGQAFEIEAGGGGGVFVVCKRGRLLWIETAHGRAADDLTELGFQLVEEMARQAGCDEIGFQTARAGLVRKSERYGFEQGGWIMKKKVAL